MEEIVYQSFNPNDTNDWPWLNDWKKKNALSQIFRKILVSK